MTFSRGTFKAAVSEHGQTTERRGLVCAYFGLDGDRYGYTITHLATGRKVTDAKDLRTAREAAEELAGLRGVNWATADVANVCDRTKARIRNVCNRYREMK